MVPVPAYMYGRLIKIEKEYQGREVSKARERGQGVERAKASDRAAADWRGWDGMGPMGGMQLLNRPEATTAVDRARVRRRVCVRVEGEETRPNWWTNGRLGTGCARPNVPFAGIHLHMLAHVGPNHSSHRETSPLQRRKTRLPAGNDRSQSDRAEISGRGIGTGGWPPRQELWKAIWWNKGRDAQYDGYHIIPVLHACPQISVPRPQSPAHSFPPSSPLPQHPSPLQPCL